MSLYRNINTWFSQHEPLDKVAHFVLAGAFAYLMAASMIFGNLSIVIGVLLPTLASVIKERTDKHAEVLDIIATICGTLVGTGLGVL